MIIKEFQLDKILTENYNFLCFLFYGPNEGLVRKQIDRVIRYYSSEHGYEALNLHSKEIDADNYAIDNNLKTVSMFFNGKVLTIDALKDKHLSIIEPIVEARPSNSILILKSENLIKSSKIRKFFENNKLCYSLACYEDDSKSLMQQIEKFVSENKLSINRDVKNYLMQSLSNDRMINQNELEKIKLYFAKSDNELSLNEIKFLLNDSSSQNLNKMNEAVMYGDAIKSSKIINKLLTEGTGPISLIRSLIQYLIRLQKTKIEMKRGNNFDNAIKHLKPPLFWKDKDSFQKHCLRWPLQGIEKSIEKLLETEISCKLNSKLASLNCEKSILLIATNAKKYFLN